MLEKNRDYIEFTLQTMMATHRPYRDGTDVSMTGMANGYDMLWAGGLDIPCDVVVISKRAFDRLQAKAKDAETYAETYAECIDDMEEACQSYRDTIEDLKKKLAELEMSNKDLEECLKQSQLKEVMRSRLLYDHHPWAFRNVPIEEYLAKRGFTCVAEAIDNLDATVKSYRDMFDGCEPAYVKQRIDEMKDEIENLHKKLSERTHTVYLNDPLNVIARWERVTGYDNPEAFLKWKANIEGIMEAWKDATGCKYPGDARRLLEKWQTMTRSETPENAAKWIERFEETDKRCDELAREIQEWKDMTKCETPKAAATWINSYEKACERGNKLFEDLNEWKKITGYSTPEEAKTFIESGMSWHNAYMELKVANKALGDTVESWKYVTGYSTPKDYLAARISGAFHTPFDYTAVWQKATGCKTPDDVEIRIKALNERINESEADYNHLLALTGFESEGEIEDALDQCDHSTLRKALVNYEFDYVALLKCTGYKSEHDIRVLLNNGEQFVYKDMRELVNSLKRQAKFTESNWQKATGCDTPGRAEEKLEYYKERLSKAVQAASCAQKHLANITF